MLPARSRERDQQPTASDAPLIQLFGGHLLKRCGYPNPPFPEWVGKFPHDCTPDVYKEHDILVFLSTNEEGLALVMVEAMLAGCAVLTTGSGGAIEVAELASLPLIPKGDPVALRNVKTDLATSPDKVDQLALRGQEVAQKEFSLDVMISRWETTIAPVRTSFRRSYGEPS